MQAQTQPAAAVDEATAAVLTELKEALAQAQTQAQTPHQEQGQGQPEPRPVRATGLAGASKSGIRRKGKGKGKGKLKPKHKPIRKGKAEEQQVQIHELGEGQAHLISSKEDAVQLIAVCGAVLGLSFAWGWAMRKWMGR